MSKAYRAVVIEKAGGPFVIKDLPHRELEPNEVLVKVEACGCCHSDAFAVLGHWPTASYPRGALSLLFLFCSVLFCSVLFCSAMLFSRTHSARA